MLLSSPASADFSGEVRRVVDGDTIEVLVCNVPVLVRLRYIDAPERKQAWGAEATAFVRQAVADKTVRIMTHTRDGYGRFVGEVILPDGASLNRMLVDAGLAWVFAAYKHDQVWDTAQAVARLTRIGLWADDDPMPPWAWRSKNNRSAK
jgi:endonuclease YncB( thermonuclease family)